MTPQERRTYHRLWRARNPDKCKAYRLATVAIPENRVKAQARGAKYRAAHPERLSAVFVAWYAKNREQRLAYTKQWTAEHPDYRRAWRIANADKDSAQVHRRRARINENGRNDLSASQIEAMWKWGFCSYCGVRTKMTVDHVVSLENGGENTLSNVVPACGPCNSSKGVKTWVPTWPATVEARA